MKYFTLCGACFHNSTPISHTGYQLQERYPSLVLEPYLQTMDLN